MRFLSFFFFSVGIQGLVTDIPVELRYSRYGPVVTDARTTSSGSAGFVLDTTRMQSVIVSPDSEDERIEIVYTTNEDGEDGIHGVVIPQLEEYPIEPIDLDAELTNRIAAGFGSDFGHAVGSMMLLPPASYNVANIEGNVVGTRFPVMMVLNPSNPSIYCYQGWMGFAHGQGTGEGDMGIFTLKVGVSVIGNGEEPPNVLTSNEATDGLHNGYYIDTTSQFDRIPEYVMIEWMTAVEQAGLHINDFPTMLPGTNVYYNQYSLGPQECQSTRHLFPSFMYTVLVGENEHDDRVAARIVLTPEDYMPTDPTTGNCVVQLVGDGFPTGFGNTYKLGMNFINRAALFFDYVNNQIGVGDPL